ARALDLAAAPLAALELANPARHHPPPTPRPARAPPPRAGGPRQRISLARALLKRAPVLILDEATSALDPVNEMAISDTLRTLAGRCTLLVIAHRLPTVVAADRILVLDGGKVAESGTHEDLLAEDGIYRHFWQERSRVQGWRLRSGAGA
ncbi:ATP-binding cassette domain-containing protein, partial [Streptomyces anulatus]|uniref:ATP-binding cassette domain-containing protein n=1 Tax=Streptomyces anulatus TaxID=1892 RepID=UPI00368F2A3B